MTSPAEFTKSVCDSLALTVNELQDLPHITKKNKDILDQELTKLGEVLYKCTYESWTVREANLALQSLNDALVKTSRLVSKWKKRRIRLVLDKSTFVDELSDAVVEIQKSCGQLQTRQNHREAARAIGEQLNTVVQGLRDEEPGNTVEAKFKEELLDFVRSNHSKSKTFEDAVSVVTWLADYFDTDVHSIEQDLQEMKENADTLLNAQRDMGTELLEKLILSLNELEKQSVTLASTKAKLICTLCDSQMICPVMIDSGLSFCKACIEERFKCGSMTCPETHLIVGKSFVVNVTLQNVVACFGEAEEMFSAESFTEEGESSDASLSHREFSDCYVVDESSDRKSQLGLEFLDSPSKVTVQRGFHVLRECASSPGGRLAVFNAKYTRPPPAAPAPPIMVIPTVIAKVKTQDSTYPHLAVKLMAALTSSKGGASHNSGEPDSRIILEDDALDFIVSLMNEEGFAKNRLLAAETLANSLVNKEVRDFVRCKEGIVPSLVALSNADIASPKDREKANYVGLKGLQRLAKCFKRGTKSKKIVLALIKLLKKGLNHPKGLKILVKDSLVALEIQVLEMDHGTSTNEVYKVVWKEMKELMKIEGISVSHASVPGRMAIINIMMKLCDLFKEDIDDHVFLYLLKMIKYTRSEIKSLPGPSSPSLHPHEEIEDEKLKKNLTELVNRSVRLLCFCVTHGQSTSYTAQSVLSKHDEEGRTLEELLVDGETLGISDESKLEILSILEQINMLSTRAITILVKTSESKNQNCRQQVAQKLRMLIEGKQHITKFIQAEGIAALLLLLNDSNLNCKQDALVALQALPPCTTIPVDKLPLESILYFLIQEGPNYVTHAAIGLFDLMVKGKAVSVDKFLEYEGALEAILRLSDTDSNNPSSQKSASALLVMAKEHQNIRTRIVEYGPCGLNILVKYVRNLGNNKVKELLIATLVQFCVDGETYQKAVIEADGHRFLITSLQERISKEEAARGLLELIENTRTILTILNGGFVAIALESIDGRFVCKDIACGLDRISFIQEGLYQIHSNSSSVSALLTLLEHCPDPSGKNAAASIISRLYPLLSTQRERITEKCQLLLNYLDPFETNHIKGFLQALVAFAAEPEGRKMIHQIDGHKTLNDHLLEMNSEIQGLVLKTLSEMSSDISDNGVETYDAKMIRTAFMDIEVGKKVFNLLNKDEFHRREESMKDALILIKNLSLTGSYASSQLVEEGVVNVLLKVLERHERFSPIVTELALKALEKVLDVPKGKPTFIKGGGIKTLVAIIRIDALGRADDAFRRANVAIIILIAVAKDPHSRKHAIETIFDGDILTALNKIIFEGQPGKVKYQAAVMMKLLAMYGPSRVFVAIKENNCLDALISLRREPDCKAMAMDALNFVSEKNKVCREYLQKRN